MAGTATTTQKMTTEETRNVSVSFKDMLDSGELLIGNPTVTDGLTSTITNAQVNPSALTINGGSVIAGQAVQFTIAAAEAGTHEIEIKVNTDASQVLEGVIKINCQETTY